MAGGWVGAPPLARRTGRPHGCPGRPTSPLPCTTPIPLALHADRWPCGPSVTQYTAAWRVLGSNPPPGMSVGTPTVLSAPNFFLSRPSILPRAVGEDLTSPTRGTGAPRVPGRWFPPLLCPPPKAQRLRERPYLLKPHAPTTSPLVQSNGRPHGRSGRPTSPLPCTTPIPLAPHADPWPCGPAVTQYIVAWRVLGSNPPPGMSVGTPTVLSAPNFFLSRRSILPRAVGEDLTSPNGGTGAPKVPVFPSPSLLLYPPPPTLARPLPAPYLHQHTRDRTRRCMPRSQTAWYGGECGAPEPDFPNERHSVGP